MRIVAEWRTLNFSAGLEQATKWLGRGTQALVQANELTIDKKRNMKIGVQAAS